MVTPRGSRATKMDLGCPFINVTLNPASDKLKEAESSLEAIDLKR